MAWAHRPRGSAVVLADPDHNAVQRRKHIKDLVDDTRRDRQREVVQSDALPIATPRSEARAVRVEDRARDHEDVHAAPRLQPGLADSSEPLLSLRHLLHAPGARGGAWPVRVAGEATHPEELELHERRDRGDDSASADCAESPTGSIATVRLDLSGPLSQKTIGVFHSSCL